MTNIHVRVFSPVEGWAQASCSCDWESGRSVSGNRVKQELADHVEDVHGTLVDPRQLVLPPGVPE